MTFGELTRLLMEHLIGVSAPVNLILEAPLSVAFRPDGNPTGRVGERRNAKTRYGYVGLGCTVMVAATYLLRSLVEAAAEADVRLFEGFVSFKSRDLTSSHAADVLALRELVQRGAGEAGQIIGPDALKLSPYHQLFSAFRVAGMDCGVPPVMIVLGVQKGCSVHQHQACIALFLSLWHWSPDASRSRNGRLPRLPYRRGKMGPQ